PRRAPRRSNASSAAFPPRKARRRPRPPTGRPPPAVRGDRSPGPASKALESRVMDTLAAHARLAAAVLAVAFVASCPSPEERWVERTLGRMTLDEKIAQHLVPSVTGVFASTDSGNFDEWRRLVRERKVGGVHVFGGSEAVPSVLLNPSYGTGGSRARKSQPLETAARLLRRLQREAGVPLLVTADFEGGVGFQVEGATRLPRAMAMGASRDGDLVFRAAELAAREGRSLGVHVNFYPVVDVNNNPRNPII